jgi:hypothetical protein
LVPVIESELAFLEVEIKGCFWDPVELHKTPFRIGPERFDAIDVAFAVGKLIGSMVDTIMLFVAQINQAIVTTPRVGVNDTFKLYSTSDNALQRLFCAVGNDFRIDHALPLKDAEDRGFVVGAAASLSFDPLGSEVGFINFNFSAERRRLFTELGDPGPDKTQVTVNGVTVLHENANNNLLQKDIHCGQSA